MNPPDATAADERYVNLDDLIDDRSQPNAAASRLRFSRRRGRHRARSGRRFLSQKVGDSPA